MSINDWPFFGFQNQQKKAGLAVKGKSNRITNAEFKGVRLMLKHLKFNLR